MQEPQKFPNINIISSDDPLLRKEAVEERVAYGRTLLPNADFLLFTSSDLGGVGSANLKQLENEMSDPGLFGGDRIIKINLNGLDTIAVDVFTSLATNFRPGIYIVVELPQIKSTYAKVKPLDPSPLKRFLSFQPGTAGGEALDAQSSDKKKKAKKVRKGKETLINESLGYLKFLGADIQIIYQLDESKIKGWIVSRAQRYGLGLDPAAVDLISNCADNNLLLIDQSLQVLSFTYPNTRLGVDVVDTYFTHDSRYTGFELPVAICQKEYIRALNIINSVCSGPGNTNSSLQNGLRMLIYTMDSTLSTIYEGKREGIDRKPINLQKSFFFAHNTKLLKTQNAYLRAIREWTPDMLQQATLCLSEAARLFSKFDYEGSYRAMQRLAMVTQPRCNGALFNLKTPNSIIAP